ncbi:uncharacterized protein LODBEIA_P60590 [Lodderomyces beijingensis]|uniref:Uncharacterized protein n=1 Tax=Lodderomyces beijingensis TaxID=1775926 RepID=A0ABP0ZXK3_9ASCO
MSEYPTLSLVQFRTALQDISQLELESKIHQQLTFIFKLVETNNELAKEIASGEASAEDAQMYRETIEENKSSLVEQIARVESIYSEFVERGLISSDEKVAREKRLLDEINERDDEVKVGEHGERGGEEDKDKDVGEVLL